MVKPNIFIVGTPKGGTTSLFNYLEAHPEIFIPKIKEPHYFSFREVKNTYYKTNIIDTKEMYLKLYKDVSNEKAIGDFSSSYLYHYESAERIKAFNPSAKIIAVLRNPVDRAISHYLMDYNLGYINVSLKEVIMNKHNYAAFYEQYVEIGFYEEQIEKYFEVFGRSNVLIILSENLFSKTEETLLEVLNYIGVNPNHKVDLTQKFNQYKKPKYEFLKIMLQSEKAKKIVNKIPESFKEGLKSIIFDKNVDKPKFKQEKIVLGELYLNSISNTEKLTKQRLDVWKNNNSEY